MPCWFINVVVDVFVQLVVVRSTPPGDIIWKTEGPQATGEKAPFREASYGQIVSKWRILDSYSNDFRRRFQLCSPQDLDKIVAAFPHRCLDLEPEVNTVGIDIENHYGRNRECFIWIRFDFCNLDFRGLASLRRDPLVFKLCPLEESASHHDESLMSPELTQDHPGDV